ncbi:DGQHR domain-containing protein [Muriicola jejuensis]|uniref:DGQHR domain-containing protein n=1 Tax=Muriicola jejuensis TaxID=504488 RepID=A0A6P0UE68_9FLAO|nr:DGQHR domain-containing protein [Muriicola jejuensis]NER10028.1 DGQHR domain-containing protein [Muriicola jejuensis]SMP03626.1 DGQHR domain-containing protein [Muriicola jejuensis]
MKYIQLPFIEINQPIGTFYICSMSWKELLDISFADIRQIEKGSENKENIDNYLGIQRKISPNRIKEISQYVTNLDATFPTSIILHIRSRSLFYKGEEITNYDDEFLEEHAEEIEERQNVIIETSKCITTEKDSLDLKRLKIVKDENVAKILDGQHRLEGLRQAIEKEGELSQFDLNATIFVDLDLDDQAQIFSVINKAQTKVNKSLVYDLYEYANHPSPQKTAHDIIRVLNRSSKSPFYRKIKILGTASEENKETETIAQATLAELIIDSISKDPMDDRDLLKRKSIFKTGGLKKTNDPKVLSRRIFRNLFIDDQTDVIYKIINNYYSAVASRWNHAWYNEPTIDRNILSKSTGVIALFRFLRYLYNKMGKRDELVSEKEFKNVFDGILLDDKDFTTDKFKPGSSGQSALFKTLVEKFENP